MLKNFVTITLRRLSKRNSFSYIHLIGLIAGFTSCLFIFLLLRYEYSFDTYHEKKDRIYRINTVFADSEGISSQSDTPFPLADAFRQDFADVELVARHLWQPNANLARRGEDASELENVYFAEAELLEMFDFELLAGEGSEALSQPGNILLSESAAKKIFKGESPIGEELIYNNNTLLQVAGIYADPPATTHIPASSLISFGSLTDEILGIPLLDSWTGYGGCTTYALYPKAVNVQSYTTQLARFGESYMTPEDASEQIRPGLQALTDIHTIPVDGNYGPVSAVSPSLIWGAISIGLLIMLMACFNFINLSLANNIKKGLEVSIRKVIGAKSSQIWGLSLGETLILSLVAMMVSVFLVITLLPQFNQLLDKSLDAEAIWTWPVLLFSLGVVLVSSLMAGAYPAWVLSRQRTQNALYSTRSIGQRQNSGIRKLMVIAQFAISLVILSGVFTVSRQLKFIQNKDLGFRHEGILQVELPDTEHNEELANEWRSLTSIRHLSFSVGAPVSFGGLNIAAIPEGGDPSVDEFIVNIKGADHAYLDTYELGLVAGRAVTAQEINRMGESFPEPDEQRPVIVNEALAPKLGIEDPQKLIGEKIVIGINNMEGEIVGVVKDFNNNSLRDALDPILITPLPPLHNQVGIQLDMSNLESTLSLMENSWKKYYMDTPFDYTFLDEFIAQQYQKETSFFQLLSIFAVIAVVIACLGLFGLVAIFTEQRRREVGLRKVLGASVKDILNLLSRNTMILLTIASAIAFPVAWWTSNRWLEDFAYHVEFSWGILILASLGLILLGLLSISSHTVKAALMNPADIMRND